MNKLIISLLALALSAGALVDAAQAARLGGGRSLGVQRQVTAPPRQATPPTQQQQPAAAPQPAGSRWLAPLAGLAAGLGLGWLFAQGGFGAAMGALLMALLAGAAVYALARLSSGRLQRSRPMQYAGPGSPMPSQASLSESSPSASAQRIHRSNVPAGFDAERFLAEAKRNFLRLQEANDRGDLDLIREVTTEEMFRALESGRAGGVQAQQTDVVTLNAVLLELVAEGGLYWASVRLSGSIREKAQAAAEPFEEVWHLQKPADGSTGWLLAGIQQLN